MASRRQQRANGSANAFGTSGHNEKTGHAHAIATRLALGFNGPFAGFQKDCGTMPDQCFDGNYVYIIAENLSVNTLDLPD